MRRERAGYCVERGSADERTTEWFTAAHAAMQAVNQLRVLRVGDVVIRDDAGKVLSERQLAMIVMEERLIASRALMPAVGGTATSNHA